MTQDWTSTTFRAALTAMVRRRVPEADVEDVVQTALAEAVATRDRPADPEGARRWIWGVARHKIADYHRRARRESPEETQEPATPSPTEAEEHALLRWAVGELPEGADAHKTFEWLLREGDGETLEDIAEAEQLPAPQVRQRVSRLRRLFRSRWAALVAAGLAALVAWVLLRRARPASDIAHHPPRVQEAPELVANRARARALRDEARRAAERNEWTRCLEALDAAKTLDGAGDDTDDIRTLRRRAQDAIERERSTVPPPVHDVGDGSVEGPTTGSWDGLSSDLSARPPPRRRRNARDGGVALPVPPSSLGSF